MRIIYFIFIGLLLLGCSQSIETDHQFKVKTITVDINPAAVGFNANNSDQKAIEIANKVMKASGGRKAWDRTKVIKWNFFGARTLTWNKHSGDVRIDVGDNDSTVYIVNLINNTGQVKIDGEEITHPDSLAVHLEDAKSIWINDSYWLFLPYKLKDSGLTLTYLKIDTANGGVASHVLELTFDAVGDTPENKYHVFVDTTTLLVNQWSYFSTRADEQPRFTTPWADYATYGELKLSGNRGRATISEIEV